MPKIKQHIHIVAFMQPTIEQELNAIRLANNISITNPLSTIIIQQGCAGILTALELAHTLIKSYEDPYSENILITCENNMLLSAHQRHSSIAFKNNIDDWLWPAIFGEGVGAIIVGSIDSKNFISPFTYLKGTLSSHQSNIGWIVNHIFKEVVTDEWRVSYQWKNKPNHTRVIIKAREVSETYLKGITRNVRLAIEKSDDINNIFRVCLHESNPNLMIQVADSLGIPKDKIPSISKHVGTLAGVSAFSLLDKANRDFIQCSIKDETVFEKNLIFSLIGEAGGRVDAGHLHLTPVII